MVRPIVEYASPAWSPYTDRDISKLKQVQKNAASFVTNIYDPLSSSSGLVSYSTGPPLKTDASWHKLKCSIKSVITWLKFPFLVM